MPPPAIHIEKPLDVMIAAGFGPCLGHRRAAELAAPDDQRVVEHAALLEIVDQRGRGLIGTLAAAAGMCFRMLP